MMGRVVEGCRMTDTFALLTGGISLLYFIYLDQLLQGLLLEYVI